MKEIRLKNIELGDTGADAKDKINQNDANLRDSILTVDNKYYTLDKQNVKKENLSQTLGSSENLIPSEKAVRDALSQYPTKNEVALGTILKGNKANEAEIKSLPNTRSGDTYRALDTNHYWTFDGKEWNDLGSILPNDTVTQSTICNVSQLNNNYTYPDKQSARNAVPLDKRAKGQIITYEILTNGWIIEQYIGNNRREWTIDENWIIMPNNIVTYKIADPINITEQFKAYERSGVYIYTPDSIPEYPLGGYRVAPDTYKIIDKIRLKPNTKYQIITKGRIYPNQGIAFLYKKNSETASKIHYLNEDTKTWTFETDNSAIYLSIQLFFPNDGTNTNTDINYTAYELNKIRNLDYKISEGYYITRPNSLPNYQVGTYIAGNRSLYHLIDKYKLKPHTEYTISFDVPNNWSGGIYINFYSSLNDKFASKYVEINDGYLSFVTDFKYLYISFQTLINNEGVYLNIEPSLKITEQINDYCLILNGEPYKISETQSYDNNLNKALDLTNYSDYKLNKPNLLSKVDIIAEIEKLNTNKNKIPCEIHLYSDCEKVYKMMGTIAYQGTTSISFPKKNFSIKLKTVDNSKQRLKIGDWVLTDSFHLKANYIDFTQARNIACANLMWQITSNRKIGERFPFETAYSSKTSNIIERFDTGARLVIDGFPLELYTNGKYHGLYTWNLSKTNENYQLDPKNNYHIHMEMMGTISGKNMFDYPVRWDGWEMRLPKYNTGIEPPNSEQKTSIELFMKWISGINDINTFRNESSKHLHNTYNLTAYLLSHAVGHWDSRSKNTQLLSWDGKRFAICLYDLDTTFKLMWNGTSLQWNEGTNGDMDNSNNNKLYEYYYKAFKPELNNLWNDLKSTILSYNNVKNTFLNIINKIGLEAYQKDAIKWTNIPSNSKCYTDINQIMNAYEERLIFMDQKFGKHLD